MEDYRGGFGKLTGVHFCITKFLKLLWDGHLARPDHAT